MPKSILITPAEMRRRTTLTAPELPLNAYQPDPAQAAQTYGRANLVRIYRDMLYLRELEEAFFPQKEWIIDTLHERILPLPGHRVTTVQSNEEILRRNRLGV